MKTKEDLVSLAREIAEYAHAGQSRRGRHGDVPYIYHVEDVAERLEGESEDVIAAAWLHDVIEDTDIRASTLEFKGVSQDVIDAVVLLTKSYDVEYGEYLARIRSNTIARKVKIADMISNLSDLPTDKQIVKYAGGLLYLMS